MRRFILALVATAAGLALLLSFKTHATGTGASPAIVAPAGGPGAGGAGAGAGGSGPAGTISGGSAGGPGTVTGNTVHTVYGPIQVTITESGGKITGVSVPVYPDATAEDTQINKFAIPELIRETESAGSAKIDMVSGATYTSQGYISSLQSALDKVK